MTYWEKRAEMAVGRMESSVNGAVPELIQSFEKAKKELIKEIYAFYAKHASENGVSLAEAQKQLSFAELREFKGSLKEYERLAKNSIGTYDLQVANLSRKARITRLQALEAECDTILQRLYQEQEKLIQDVVKDVYTQEYYRSQFEIERYTGFMYEFSKIPTSAIEQVIMTPVFGADLSTRLWRQDMDTGFKIRQSLNEMFITGQPPQKFADDLQKIIGARDKSGNLTGKKYEAYRVLYSEGAQALSQSQLQAYIDDDMEYYQIIATLDNKTSEICRSLDGCIFSVTKGGDVPQKYVKGDNEYQRRAYDAKSVISGINFPIFHPNCRTTTAVYIPNLKESKRTRMARDKDGKSARVKDMTYQEWYKGHVDRNKNNDIIKLEERYSNIKNDEKRLVKRKNETAIIYGPNGETLFIKNGGARSVSFTRSEVNKMKGGILTHNHPENTTFSPADIYMLKRAQLSEIRAATKGGTYMLRPPAVWDERFNSKQKIWDEYSKLEKEIEPGFHSQYKSGEITIEQYNQRFQHEILKKLSEKFGLEYHYEEKRE